MCHCVIQRGGVLAAICVFEWVKEGLCTRLVGVECSSLLQGRLREFLATRSEYSLYRPTH